MTALQRPLLTAARSRAIFVGSPKVDPTKFSGSEYIGLGAMKKLLLAILLITGGCSSGGGQSDSISEADFETKIATSIAFDPALLKNGDRVSYLVKQTGENSQRYTWSAVSEDRAGLWIENNMPFNVSRMVVKTKLDRSGKIL